MLSLVRDEIVSVHPNASPRPHQRDTETTNTCTCTWKLQLAVFVPPTFFSCVIFGSILLLFIPLSSSFFNLDTLGAGTEHDIRLSCTFLLSCNGTAHLLSEFLSFILV